MEQETEIKLESLTEDALKQIISERDEAKKVAAQREAERDGVVSEIKELRTKKAELEEKLKPKDGGQSVEEIVAAQLAQAEKERQLKAVEQTQVSARNKFLAEHKEFLPENDPSGVRKAALESKLARFNLAGAKTEDDALEILNDAYELLSRKENSGGSQDGVQTPPATGGSSRHVGNSSLTAKELGVIQRIGWTREKYIQTKLKHPELVSELFK